MSFSFPRFNAIDGNGNPIRGGLLSTYEEGTSTDKSAFTDIGLTVAHANPIVLDSEGEALIHLKGRYKMNLTTATGAQVPGWPIDNIGDPAQGAAAVLYPEAAATDQGVTGDSNTVKYAVDTIGATNKGTIYLRHDGGGEFTDYTFSTSETIPSNITFEREPGARLSIDSGKVVTLNGPIAWPGTIHTITGSGTIAFGQGYVDTVYPQWWGALADGSTDNASAIQAAITAMSSPSQTGYGIVYFRRGVYGVGTTIELKEGVVLEGVSPGASVTEGSILKLLNSTNADLVRSEIAQDGTGTSHWTGLRNIGLDGNKANNTSGDGVSIGGRPGENFTLQRMTIVNFADNGINLLRGTNGLSIFDNIFLAGNGSDGGGSGFKALRDTGDSFAPLYLNNISGDNNGRALIYIAGNGVTGIVSLNNVKAEHNTASRQDDVIILDNCANHIISISNVYATTTSDTTTSVINIIDTNAPLVRWTNIWAQSPATTNIYEDEVNSISIAASASGDSVSSSGYSWDLDLRGGVRIGGGTKITAHLTGTATWDPINLADGASTSTTVTVTGAAVGDTVAVGHTKILTEVMHLTGHVSSANTVTVVLTNHSGGAIDITGGGTLRADVWQH